MPILPPLSRPIKVLIVDDSALIRQMLGEMLSASPEFEVVGTAPDPLVAREKIKRLNPDMITLDIEMPNMDGIEFLRRLMALRPTRVLMVSTLTARNADITLHALELGAIDCLEKPRDMGEAGLSAFREELLHRARIVGTARLPEKPTAPPPAAQSSAAPLQAPDNAIIGIGASTGGVEALITLFSALPPMMPPIAVVQHMPTKFTASFAKRLKSMSALDVREARDGELIDAGSAVVAPGGYHMQIRRTREDRYMVALSQGEPVSGHCPSVDVMFSSLARCAGPNAVGVILTGMGRDGADGMLAMHRAGAWCIGQDAQSALVYGMPRVAHELGGVDEQAALTRIPSRIVRALAERAGRQARRVG
ncbi:MAG: chemotaxis response regulator protein-glutamate methylesterase [Proteobacteria bacterium]|nr:chemotaxis response regulator protein-glutamate methylesterase [Pseudomonadota bacterium]